MLSRRYLSRIIFHPEQELFGQASRQLEARGTAWIVRNDNYIASTIQSCNSMHSFSIGTTLTLTHAWLSSLFTLRDYVFMVLFLYWLLIITAASCIHVLIGRLYYVNCCIKQNFHMVQTFTVFTDYPTTLKIITAESFNSPVVPVLPYAGFCCKNKNR